MACIAVATIPSKQLLLLRRNTKNFTGTTTIDDEDVHLSFNKFNNGSISTTFEMTFRTSLGIHASGNSTSLGIHYTRRDTYTRLLLCDGGSLKCLSRAASSGFESSITDPNLDLQTAKVTIESKDDDKMQIKVDMSGSETEEVFDELLSELASTAPPIPGFRRAKGGKYAANVPKSFILQAVGEERVTNFAIQQIISSSITNYVEKENLNVKEKFNTIQTAEELKSAFSPGKDFSFNAILEFEIPDLGEEEVM